MNRELIKNLKNLKNDGRLNPDRAWLARNREEVLDCVRRQSENQKAARPNFLEVLSEGLHVFVSGRVLGLARTGLTVFLIGILAVGGWIASVSASYSSLPGEILYGVKIAAEKTELIVASVIGSKEDEVTTILKHASTRVDEYQRSKSAEQSSEAIESLKKKIESTQESLDDASQSTSKTAVAVARVVEKKTGEILDSLADKRNTQTPSAELGKEIVEAEALIQKAGIKAVEVLVERVESGGVDEAVISKAEVKDTINRRLDKLVSDVSKLDLTERATRQNASSTIAIMTATSTVISSDTAGNTSTLKDAENFVSSTENIIAKIDEAAQKVVEANKKVAETKTDVKNLIDQNNLTGALDKIKELDGIKSETKVAVEEASTAVATAEKAVTQPEVKPTETPAPTASSTGGVVDTSVSTTAAVEAKSMYGITTTIKIN